jgi:hypothetical protein
VAIGRSPSRSSCTVRPSLRCICFRVQKECPTPLRFESGIRMSATTSFVPGLKQVYPRDGRRHTRRKKHRLPSLIRQSSGGRSHSRRNGGTSRAYSCSPPPTTRRRSLDNLSSTRLRFLRSGHPPASGSPRCISGDCGCGPASSSPSSPSTVSFFTRFRSEVSSASRLGIWPRSSSAHCFFAD